MCSSDLELATEIYTLSLHDALPIWIRSRRSRLAHPTQRYRTPQRHLLPRPRPRPIRLRPILPRPRPRPIRPRPIRPRVIRPRPTTRQRPTTRPRRPLRSPRRPAIRSRPSMAMAGRRRLATVSRADTGPCTSPITTNMASPTRIPACQVTRTPTRIPACRTATSARPMLVLETLTWNRTMVGSRRIRDATPPLRGMPGTIQERGTERSNPRPRSADIPMRLRAMATPMRSHHFRRAGQISMRGRRRRASPPSPCCRRRSRPPRLGGDVPSTA